MTRESGFSARNPSPQLSTRSRGVGASPLPNYSRHPRSPYSPKTEEFYNDGFSPQDEYARAPPFRFPGDDESDTSSLQRPPSIRSQDGAASPRYQSDPDDMPSVPESVHSSTPSLSYEGPPGAAPLSRTTTRRGTKRRVTVGPPSMDMHQPKVPWHEAKAWRHHTHTRVREKRDLHHRDSLVKDALSDEDLETGRHLSYSYGRELNPPPPPPTPDIHPYVMNFTSPIDLLDTVDYPPGSPRAI